MATEEAARRWKEELDKLCSGVSCEAEEADPGECCEEEIILPESVDTLGDWIDYLKLLKLASESHCVYVRVGHGEGGIFVFAYGPQEDDMDALADRRYESEKDEALFGGGN